MTCAECGCEVGIISFRVSLPPVSGDALRKCKRCYLQDVPRSVRGPRPRKCNYCGDLVDVTTANYVKTRDAYYCGGKECQLLERRAKRARSSPRVSVSGTAAKSVGVSKPTAESGTNGTGEGCQTRSGGQSASKTSPEPSKTAPSERLDLTALGRVLRIEGLDLPDRIGIEENDGCWIVDVVGRMDKHPAGTRIIKKIGANYVIHKERKPKESDDERTFDPLGGM